MARDAALIAGLQARHENSRYLDGIALPDALRYDADLGAALMHGAADDALCVIAAPVAGLRTLCHAMRDAGCVPAHVVWVCKGFEADTHLLPHQVIAAELPSSAATACCRGRASLARSGSRCPLR